MQAGMLGRQQKGRQVVQVAPQPKGQGSLAWGTGTILTVWAIHKECSTAGTTSKGQGNQNTRQAESGMQTAAMAPPLSWAHRQCRQGRRQRHNKAMGRRQGHSCRQIPGRQGQGWGMVGHRQVPAAWGKCWAITCRKFPTQALCSKKKEGRQRQGGWGQIAGRARSQNSPGQRTPTCGW